MKYSTTSLSAITLCVWMMLSHHTNGTDMWGTQSSFTNNNPNQIRMAGQPWNQQPNTNIQFIPDKWNSVTPPMRPNNKQVHSQSSKKMIIHATEDPRNWDLYVSFSGKYRFKSIRWSGKSIHAHYKMKATWNRQNVLVTCYKDNKKYEKVKAFYDHIEGLTDHISKKYLDNVLLKRIDNAQSANKLVGCFVFEHPEEYISLRSFFMREASFAMAKHIPNMIARIMKAVSYLNGVGVAYNSVGVEHILVSDDDKNNINGIKLINFDRSVIFKEYAKSMARSELYQDQRVLNEIYKTYLTDVKQTGAFIDSCFNAYNSILNTDYGITNLALLPQVELYYKRLQKLQEISARMKSAIAPFMMLNFIYGDDYDMIEKPAIKNY